MLKQTEGSYATAEAIALCRPEVVCAYPITPQTHIVEGLGEMVRSGDLKNCEFINVESVSYTHLDQSRRRDRTSGGGYRLRCLLYTSRCV